MPFGQGAASLPVHCIYFWQPFPTSQVCSLYCASALPGTQVPTHPNRNDTGHAASCTSWNVRKAGSAGVWRTDHAISDQGGRLDLGSVNMKHCDMMWRDAFWETLTCSPPLPDRVQPRTQDRQHNTAEKHDLITEDDCQHYSMFTFSFLQVCLWWAEPSSTRWWVRPGCRRQMPSATPTSWRGWPSLWRWSADSSMSSWESENEPLLHPSVPSNPLPNCKCHQSPSEV